MVYVAGDREYAGGRGRVMGCDIYSVCEVFDPVAGAWRDAGYVFPADTYGTYPTGKKCNNPFSIRNYFVFALLAGVRNSYGIVPISMPRGIPIDWHAREDRKNNGDDWVGEGSEMMMNWWCEDAHSHSWLLAGELLSVDYVGISCRLSREFTTSIEILSTLGPPDKVRVVFWFDN